MRKRGEKRGEKVWMNERKCISVSPEKNSDICERIRARCQCMFAMY